MEQRDAEAAAALAVHKDTEAWTIVSLSCQEQKLVAPLLKLPSDVDRN